MNRVFNLRSATRVGSFLPVFVLALVVLAVVGPSVSFGIVTTWQLVTLDVPDPADPKKCIKVNFGEVVARIGSDGDFHMISVIGFRKTYNGPTCCDSLHYLNIVTSDPRPPTWKDSEGKVHKVGNNIYIDPLSGGNIGWSGTNPDPVTDRKPWYDGEQANRKASTTGDFESGEKKEYDLNDFKNAVINWTSDPMLDLLFVDRPSRINGLQFVTTLMCVKGKHMCPAFSVPWDYKDDQIGIGPVSLGSSYPSGLDKTKIAEALTRSGFSGYKIHDKCCPCIPAPGALLLGSIGACLVGWLRRRRTL